MPKRDREIKLSNLFAAVDPQAGKPVLFHRRGGSAAGQVSVVASGLNVGPINEHEKELIREQHPKIAKQYGIA
jgi:hypothetical protein